MNEEIENIKFDLLVYKQQYNYCKEAIKNGNWHNYTDSLKIRKDNLIVLENIIKLYEKKLQKLNNK
jgi:hypothetical protein